MEWLGPCSLCETELDRLPARAIGVYAIHVFDRRSGSYPVIYIGRTSDLQRRLREHCDGTAGAPVVSVARRRSAIYFSVLRLDDMALLGPAESTLVRLLRPAGNQQVPTAHPVLVPVPPIITPFSRLRVSQPTWSS